MIFDNNVKSVWNQNERKQLILTDDHNTFSTTNWVDLTLNRWGQKRTHAKISETLISLKSFMIKQHQAPRLIFSHASLLKYIHLKPIFLVSSASKPHHVFLLKSAGG